jgi:hypothetical protein
MTVSPAAVSEDRVDFIRRMCEKHGISIHHDVAANGPQYRACAMAERDGMAFSSIGLDADGYDAVGAVLEWLATIPK